MWTALYIVCLCLLGISTAICITYCIFYAKDKVQTKQTAIILNIIAYIVPFLNFAKVTTYVHILILKSN